MIKELIKEALEELLKGEQSPEGKAQKETLNTNHPLIGKRVVVRCRNAGVHFGELQAVGDFVILRSSHRIWKWEGAFTLNEVSQTGISSGRVSAVAETLSIPIGDVAEILNLTNKAYVSISKCIED